MTLEGVRVPKERVLDGRKAYETPTTRGPFSQIIHVAIDVGIARAAIDETIDLLKKGRDSRPVPADGSAPAEDADEAVVIATLGDLVYRLHAAEALLERAARALDAAWEGQEETRVIAAAVAVAEAKIAATEISLQATNALFELVGEDAASARLGLDRHWRNARVHTLHDPVRWKFYAVGNWYLNGKPPPRHAWS